MRRYLKRSNYVFVRIVEMTYHCHKVDMNRGGSYVDLPDWIKNKKCCINPKNEEDDECFRWAVITALHYEEIGAHPERISKIRPYLSIGMTGVASNFPHRVTSGKNLRVKILT